LENAITESGYLTGRFVRQAVLISNDLINFYNQLIFFEKGYVCSFKQSWDSLRHYPMLGPFTI
jgi:hypothetical protein